MNTISCCLLFLIGYLKLAFSLQTGYTCETSLVLTCPEGRKLAILEVTYSSECPTINEETNGGSIYAPSLCLGYSRDRASNLCNGKQNCSFDHSLEQRPSFIVGKQANCDFKGQSVNIEYSCVPDFFSSKLPRVDICSLQSLDGLQEGFIHTPNYPNGYPNSQVCSKTVPSPKIGHRLKMFLLEFDLEGLSVLRILGITRVNDWFQINNSGEKMFGTKPAFTLVFDDVIEASLMFKSDFANTKRPYTGFLIYFIITSIPGQKTSTSRISTTSSTTTVSIIDILTNRNEKLSSSIEPKVAALLNNDRPTNNAALTFLVVMLTGILVVILCAFLLYKRRNDRRIRYLADMFNSLFPGRTAPVTLNMTENGDETTLNNTIQSKIDYSIVSPSHKVKKFNDENDEISQTPIFKQININEKRQTLEKEVLIENLRGSSPYLSSNRPDRSKFNTKDQINMKQVENSNIYSEDPLSSRKIETKQTTNSAIYESVDLETVDHQEKRVEQEEIIYDVINTTTDRMIPDQTDDSELYATPKNNN